jgi:hypothetical protein
MFDCKIGGINSISFQKGTTQGYLDLVLIKAGKILNEVSTTTDYGMGISFWQVLMPYKSIFLDPLYNLFHYNSCIPTPKERYGSRSAK